MLIRWNNVFRLKFTFRLKRNIKITRTVQLHWRDNESWPFQIEELIALIFFFFIIILLGLLEEVIWALQPSRSRINIEMWFYTLFFNCFNSEDSTTRLSYRFLHFNCLTSNGSLFSVVLSWKWLKVLDFLMFLQVCKHQNDYCNKIFLSIKATANK